MPNPRSPKQPITGEERVVTSGFRARVYAKVQQVPRGAVSTYGDVAGALGSRRVARQVGFALSALDKHRGAPVPWQRIINASGAISFKGDLARAELQRRLLEAEGISFDDAGKVLDFAARRHVFRAPRARPAPTKTGKTRS
jgi:methylated-DNA-protein-cysteine methyltransferase related protein